MEILLGILVGLVIVLLLIKRKNKEPSFIEKQITAYASAVYAANAANAAAKQAEEMEVLKMRMLSIPDRERRVIR